MVEPLCGNQQEDSPLANQLVMDDHWSASYLMLRRLSQQLSSYLHRHHDVRAANLVVPSAHAVCPVWDGHAGFPFPSSHLAHISDGHPTPVCHVVGAPLCALRLAVYNLPNRFV